MGLRLQDLILRMVVCESEVILLNMSLAGSTLQDFIPVVCLSKSRACCPSAMILQGSSPLLSLQWGQAAGLDPDKFPGPDPSMHVHPLSSFEPCSRCASCAGCMTPLPKFLCVSPEGLARHAWWRVVANNHSTTLKDGLDCFSPDPQQSLAFPNSVVCGGG